MVVIHTVEGARTTAELGAYFAKASVQVSSHVGIDDNTVKQYVDYGQECWAATIATVAASVLSGPITRKTVVQMIVAGLATLAVAGIPNSPPATTHMGRHRALDTGEKDG
ncbi:hypothetical protein [Pseudonocardia terrae]|uniref:hypothetical protein n=1 Tax=Pseudonocardia terrae TaxID=2905831 RepID=UPI001E39D1DE|nr:hypothetical protein [Pseudonocardia terrae]